MTNIEPQVAVFDIQAQEGPNAYHSSQHPPPANRYKTKKKSATKDVYFKPENVIQAVTV